MSYYDQELTIDLFDQLQWKSSGAVTPLVYQPLIERGVLLYADTAADDTRFV